MTAYPHSLCSARGRSAVPSALLLALLLATAFPAAAHIPSEIAAAGFSATQHYRYDPLNRIAVATEGAAPGPGDSCPGTAEWCRDYDYDPYGNRAVIGWEGIAPHSLTPQSLANFSTATNRITMPNVVYDNAGNLTNTTLNEALVYDANNRQHAAGRQRLTLGLTYGSTNNNGNILTQSITAGAFSATQYYRYDPLNRLAVATEGAAPGPGDTCPGTAEWCRDYDYDPYGNRAVIDWEGIAPHSLTPQSLANFSAATNRITMANTVYDPAGNLTNTTLNEATVYDANNRQTSYTSAGAATSYDYDGQGNRVKKSGPSGTSVYIYDAFGKLAAEYSNVSPQPENVGTFYRTVDHLGSTRLVTDGLGAAVENTDYLPFGEEIGVSPNDARYQQAAYGSSALLRHKFTGKERDTESGMDYFLARYYSGPMGRFLSVDPGNAGAEAETPQSWNAYSYVMNRPLTLTDPDGRCPVCPTLSRLAAAAGPHIDKAARAVQRFGRQAYVAATRLFNSPTGVDAVETVADFVLDNPNPSSISAGDLARFGKAGLRAAQLGADAARAGRVNPLQAVGGLHLEAKLGRPLQAGTHEGVDLVDAAEGGLGAISLKGPLPTKAIGNIPGLANAILEDLSGNTATQTLVIDATNLSADAILELKTLIKEGVEQTSKRVEFLEP